MPRLPGPCPRHRWYNGRKRAPVDCLICRTFRKIVEERQAAK